MLSLQTTTDKSRSLKDRNYNVAILNGPSRPRGIYKFVCNRQSSRLTRTSIQQTVISKQPQLLNLGLGKAKLSSTLALTRSNCTVICSKTSSCPAHRWDYKGSRGARHPQLWTEEFLFFFKVWFCLSASDGRPVPEVRHVLLLSVRKNLPTPSYFCQPIGMAFMWILVLTVMV